MDHHAHEYAVDDVLIMRLRPQLTNLVKRFSQAGGAKRTIGPHFAGLKLNQAAGAGQVGKVACPFNWSIGELGRRREEEGKELFKHDRTITTAQTGVQ